MRLMIHTLRTPATGWGHWFRALALLDAAHSRGHRVYIATNENPHHPRFLFTPARRPEVVGRYLRELRPDWLIVDLPGQPPDYVFENTPVCLVSGVGGDEDERCALVVNQGFTGQYGAPDYIILRRELARYQRQEPGHGWFVFGGAADVMGLLSQFHKACRAWPATLVVTPDTPEPPEATARHTVVNCADHSIFGLAAACEQACISTGMIAWELACLQTQMHLLSLTESHLETALEMDRRGWAKAWPEVGMPGQRRLRAFLKEPYEYEAPGIGGRGAERVIRLLEEA